LIPTIFLLLTKRPTAGVTGAGVGVDSAWEQKKLEARKMLENAAESPASSAPNQDRGAIIFPERTWSCSADAVLGDLAPTRMLAV